MDRRAPSRAHDASASGRFSLAGGVSAGVLNASGFHVGRDAAETRVLLGSGSSVPISILGSPTSDIFSGSGGNDTIDGGAGNDTLNGAAGGDVITTGTGNDTLGQSSSFARAGESVVASGQNLTTTIAAGQTLVFNTGSTANVDRVLDFSTTDMMDVFAAGVAPTNLFGMDGTAALTIGQSYVPYGNWTAATGTFAVAANHAAATPDALVFQGNGALSANTHTGTVVMIGLTRPWWGRTSSDGG